MTPAHYTTDSRVSLHNMRWLSGRWVRLYRTTTLINYSPHSALVLDYHRMAGYVVLYNVTMSLHYTRIWHHIWIKCCFILCVLYYNTCIMYLLDYSEGKNFSHHIVILISHVSLATFLELFVLHPAFNMDTIR